MPYCAVLFDACFVFEICMHDRVVLLSFLFCYSLMYVCLCCAG